MFEPCPAKGQKEILTVTDAYTLFLEMSELSKYLTIFIAWMQHSDINELCSHFFIPSSYKPIIIDEVFYGMRDIGKPAVVKRTLLSKYAQQGVDALQVMMNFCPPLAYPLREFGLITFNDKDFLRIDKYNNFIKQIAVTELGIAISTACYARRFLWINEHDREEAEYLIQYSDPDDAELYEHNYKKNLPGSDGFFDPFISCFPGERIDVGSMSQLLFAKSENDENTLFEFRVQLSNSCYRVIQCHGNHTFEDLHLAIQRAFDFDNDHLYAFFLDGKRQSRRIIYAPFTGESPCTDEVYIGQARLRQGQRILYLFDFGDNWQFKATLISIRESDTGNMVQLYPQIVKSVGESPDQYPSYDDWDEGWDDDD